MCPALTPVKIVHLTASCSKHANPAGGILADVYKGLVTLSELKLSISQVLSTHYFLCNRAALDKNLEILKCNNTQLNCSSQYTETQTAFVHSC